MLKWLPIVFSLLVCTACVEQIQTADASLNTKDIRIRDPYIYTDANTKTYYMYAASVNRRNSGVTGVKAYTSKDLINWTPPQTVISLPSDMKVKSVWAPEVHEFKGAYYLFVTLTLDETLSEEKPVANKKWREMQVRGTHIFRADSLLGPFEQLTTNSHTPPDWMALDGTLFVEDGSPYMVFCHEWIQVIDGTMDVIQLKDDFSGTIGTPEVLFKASSAPGANTEPEKGKITDGCFFYRSATSSKLFMIWSTSIPDSGYSVVLTESQSGKVRGPWINHKLLYKKNGGHGMIFRSFDERLLLALHHPNSGGTERLHLFELTDNGDTLEIKEEITLE